MSSKDKPKGKKSENKNSGKELASNQASNVDEESRQVSLTEIQKLLSGMEEIIIANLTSQISSNHATIAKHDQTIQEIETAMDDFDGRMATMESALSRIAKENEQLKLKVDDLENRSRRCNIRITGIPEEEEGKQPTSFIESFLQDVFGAEAL